MGVLTFDWGQITTFNGSPLQTPWWAAANIGLAVVFFAWFLLPILYVSRMYCFFTFSFVTSFPQYTNTWCSAFLPVISSQTFDNTGSPYNLSHVINDDATFNLDAYKAYSPLFMPISLALAYGFSFACYTSVLSHTVIYHRKQIWNQSRHSLAEQCDIHARLMSVYKAVPDWWYLVIFCASIR